MKQMPTSALGVPSQAGIERITQAVANEVESGDRQQNSETGEEREPRLGGDKLPALADHDPPFRYRRLRPKADETQTGSSQNGPAHVEAGLYENGREGVR